jgi:hypothetical protein
VFPFLLSSQGNPADYLFVTIEMPSRSVIYKWFHRNSPIAVLLDFVDIFNDAEQRHGVVWRLLYGGDKSRKPQEPKPLTLLSIVHKEKREIVFRAVRKLP